MFLLNLVLNIVYGGESIDVPVFEIGHIFLEGHFSNDHLEQKREQICSRSREKKKKKKIIYPCAIRHVTKYDIKFCELHEAEWLYKNDMYYYNKRLFFEEDSFEHVLFMKLDTIIQTKIIGQQTKEWIDEQMRRIMSDEPDEEIEKEVKKFFEMQFNEIQLLFLQQHMGIGEFEYLINEGNFSHDQEEFEVRAQNMILEKLEQLGIVRIAKEEEEIEEEEEEEEEEQEQMEEEGMKVNLNDIITEKEALVIERIDKMEDEIVDKLVDEEGYFMKKVTFKIEKKFWKMRKKRRKVFTEMKVNSIIVMMILTCLETRQIKCKKKKRLKFGDPDYVGWIFSSSPENRIHLKFELFVKQQNTKFRDEQELKKYLIQNFFEVKWIVM